MRIRSIKPEFWRSEDIAALDRDTRLLFIGLWSYVDDNGVGRDVEAFIVADLFALDDPSESLAMVSRGLRKLSERGLIVRYTLANKRYLTIPKWKDHQKIDHPNKDRYPLPTCEDALFATDSRDSREELAPGAVEQRNRGTEEKGKNPSPQAASAFDTFWSAFPRKVGKDDARKAFNRATKRAQVSEIIAGAERYATDPNLPDTNFIPHPATWLNGGRWTDGPCPPPPADRRPAKPNTDDKIRNTLEIGQQMKAQQNGHPYHLEITA